MLVPFLDSFLDEKDLDLALDWLSRKGYQTCFEADAAGIIKTDRVAEVLSRAGGESWTSPDIFTKMLDAIWAVAEVFPLCVVGVDNIS